MTMTKLVIPIVCFDIFELRSDMQAYRDRLILDSFICIKSIPGIGAERHGKNVRDCFALVNAALTYW